MASMVLFWNAFMIQCMMMLSFVFMVSCVTPTAPPGMFEAAFQGECGEESPCEQLCFDLHDGTYECSCKEGHTLADNGYSCHANYETEEDDNNEDLTQIQKDFLRGRERIDIFADAERYFFIRNNGYHVAYNINKRKRSKQFNGQEIQSTSSARLQVAYADTSIQSTTPMSESSPDMLQPMNTVTVTTPPSQRHSNTCDDMECENKGVCVLHPRTGVARCQCPLEKRGSRCELENEFHQPKFHGLSFLSLPPLQDADRAVLISLEFRPESYDGLLLYSGEESHLQGDFMAIVINKGFIEFRFDCGRGEGVVRSNQPVILYSWNRLSLYRDKWDAWMQLNSGKQVHGQSQGLYSRISFQQNLYLGGSPNISSIADRLQLDAGFDGCVRYMKINGKIYNLTTMETGDVIDGIDVEECNIDGCSQITCLNGGKCVATTPDDGVCVCALGFTGELCETEIEVMVPFFNNSFLQYEGLDNTVTSFVEIVIVFKPYTPWGALFYNGHKLDGSGDFLAINLLNGHVEFRFDLGTGAVTLRSPQPVSLTEWHTVYVTRTGRQGMLRVDRQPPVTALSPGAFTQLTLSLSMFLGGIPDLLHVSKFSGICTSFTGCIQKFIINGQQVKLLEHALSGRNIANCKHPCLERPCFNGGGCQPNGDKYSCHCRLGYAGTKCQKEVAEMIAEPMFSGTSYLYFTDKEIIKRIHGSSMDLSVKFKSFNPNGLILWAGQKDIATSSDYLSIGIKNGYIYLEYNLGSGGVSLVNNHSRIDDGKWHLLQAVRNGKYGSLRIDNTSAITGSSNGLLSQLNINENLFLGGIGEMVEQNHYHPSGLFGCLANMTLSSDHHVRLVIHATTGINIQPCV